MNTTLELVAVFVLGASVGGMAVSLWAERTVREARRIAESQGRVIRRLLAMESAPTKEPRCERVRGAGLGSGGRWN